MRSKKILLTLILFLFVLASIQIALAGELNMKTCFAYNRNNSFSLKDFNIYVGKISPEYEPETSRYVLKILDYSSKILFTRKLAISFFNPITNTIQETGETCYELPYYENVNKLKIFYDNKEVFSADLKNYICNKNSICDLGETQYVCPEDCIVESEGFPWIYVGISAVCVAILVAIFFLKRSRSEDWQKVYKKWQ